MLCQFSFLRKPFIKIGTLVCHLFSVHSNIMVSSLSISFSENPLSHEEDMHVFTLFPNVSSDDVLTLRLLG